MLRHKVISRDATGSRVLTHNIAGGTYSAVPTLATDGFTIKSAGGGRQYDAFECTFTYNGGDATTLAIVRAWFYVPDHAPGGTPAWLPTPTLTDVGTVSTDAAGPMRRLNSVPVGATKMYLQVDSIAGTAPTDLYMVAYGLSGDVADVAGGSGGATGGGGGGGSATASASGGGGGNFVYVSPTDFTAVYTAATQITLTGIPFVPSVEQIVSITSFDSTGAATQYVPTTNAFVYVPATGVLTVTDATFDATDVGYLVMLYGPDKGYSSATDTFQDYRTNPENAHTAGSTLAELTNVTNGTYYYYIDCDTYANHVIQFILAGAGTGAITVTLEATAQDDGTVPGSCTYHDVTNALFGVANYTATNMMIINTDTAFRYMRVKVVSTANPADQGDWTIYSRKIY